MLITNKAVTPLQEYLQFIETCAESGITSLQLCEKGASYQSLLNFGMQLKEILAPYNIPLIVNDNIDLAIALDADGVHLGQSDGDLKAVRKIIGQKKIIGVSVNSPTELQIANRLPIDYIGVGAIFPTSSKADATRIWGIDELKSLSTISHHPIVAIGGINESNAKSVIEVGASGVALIGAIHNSAKPAQTIKNILNIINSKTT